MVILAGLGNPGPEYAGHRHNVGFMLLDRIAERHGFPPFKTKGGRAASEGRLCSEKAVLVKPLDFMNASGLPIRQMVDFYKLDAGAVTVAHDDIDLAPGKVRVKEGGGHGGHNGLRDIDRHLGTEYRRLRIGVGRRPGSRPGEQVDSHVLSDFTADDRKQWLDPLLDCMADEIGLLYSGGDDNGFATAVARLRPPPAGPGNGEE